MAFYSLFQNLVLARQIKFEKGSISLLSKRVVLLNGSFFSNYIKKNEDNPKVIQDFYYSVKDSFSKDFAEGIGKKHKFDFKDFVKWMTNLAMITGWGTFSWEALNEKELEGIIRVENSPIANDLKKQVTTPVDHMIRGFIAGGASAAFKIDMDVVEEKCTSLNGKKCKFILKQTNKFNKKDSLVKYQLG